MDSEQVWRVVEPDGSVNVLRVQSIGGDMHIVECGSYGREHVAGSTFRDAVERFAAEYLVIAEVRAPGEQTTAEQLAAVTAARDADRAALDAVAALLFVPLRDLGYDRAQEVLCGAIEELYQQRAAARSEEHAVATLTRERDATLAAVDAVRADYAPREKPPTVEEVRVLARLWEMCSAPALIRTSRGYSVAHVTWLADGGIAGWCMPDARTIKQAETWLMLGPDGPVAWSQLARLVAQGDDRG